jgi:F-type H+-transporting ATPase subunit delta
MRATKKASKAAWRLFRLCLTQDRLDADRVRLVAQRVAASTQGDALAILSRFQRLVRLHHDRHTAVVESATSLTDDFRQSIQQDLGRLYGSDLETSFRENPALIGGVRVRVGSDVYDWSVQARLAAIEAGL